MIKCNECGHWHGNSVESHSRNAPDYEKIGMAVVEMADSIFTDANSGQDFCVQSVGCNTVVFGGTNRLILSQRGWRADAAYCTDRFLRSISVTHWE